MSRLRNKDIHIKVTEGEYELIMAALKASKMPNLREYLSRLLIHGYVVGRDQSGLNKLAYEVNKVGTNINQAVHLCNINGSINSENIVDLTNRLNDIYKMMEKFNRALY